jgi:DNA-binding NtrC family response regulator
MKTRGRVLVLDDDESWQNILSSPLSEANLLVDIASSTSLARELLSKNFYHIAIIDVSMMPNDATNTEGLQLLSEINQTGLGSGMEIIMISAYADKARLRESFRKYKVADFQDKFDFDQNEFLAEIWEILAENVNLDLDVEWESNAQREQVLLNMEIDGQRV